VGVYLAVVWSDRPPAASRSDVSIERRKHPSSKSCHCRQTRKINTKTPININNRTKYENFASTVSSYLTWGVKKFGKWTSYSTELLNCKPMLFSWNINTAQLYCIDLFKKLNVTYCSQKLPITKLSYGASPAIWHHTVLTATRHR